MFWPKHFDFISSSIIDGIISLSMNKRIPIGNGILTCDNKKQALERADPNKKDKGGDAAYAAIAAFNAIK